jgi:hypothetical protein
MLVFDTVTVGPGLTVVGQPIGVASRSEGFDGFDGVLGVGPSVLSRGTMISRPERAIPTFTNNLPV